MNIALDYDETYTKDPELWDSFIILAESRNHKVTIVTMRYPHEPIELRRDVIYTSRKKKIDFYQADIWIDDCPHYVYMDKVKKEAIA